MSQVLRVTPTTPETWRWPVNLAAYNRSEQLTFDEKRALASVAEPRRCSPAWERRVGGVLEHLLRPLDDVFAITKASKTQRNGSIIILLREMHRLQTSFWIWSLPEWIGVLQPSAPLFAEQHGGADTYRSHLLAVSYLLGELNDLSAIGYFTQSWLATRVFGKAVLDPPVKQVRDELLRLGFGAKMAGLHLPNLLHEVFLMNRSPRLEDLSFEVLTEIRPKLTSAYLKSYVVSFTQALVSLGYLEKPITASRSGGNLDTLSGVPGEWLKYCERWRKTSTLAKSSRKAYYWCLIKAGSWLAQYHPEVVSPEQWTRELAAEYVAAVMNFGIGDWTHKESSQGESEPVPLTAKTKVQHLKAVSSFMRDCQEWNWIPRRFDPRRAFTTPRSIQSLLGPNPRAIDDEIWAKLMWAGLNLTQQDLPVSGNSRTSRKSCYPFELVSACTLVWLFTGLRADEICRLKVGCIRWQKDDLVVTGTDEVVPKETICWLSV